MGTSPLNAGVSLTNKPASEDTDEEGWQPLSGGTVNNVRRKGDVVRRPWNPQSEAILQVFRRLGDRRVQAFPKYWEGRVISLNFDILKEHPCCVRGLRR